jgi:hypothetical protein
VFYIWDFGSWRYEHHDKLGCKTSDQQLSVWNGRSVRVLMAGKTKQKSKIIIEEIQYFPDVTITLLSI